MGKRNVLFYSNVFAIEEKDGSLNTFCRESSFIQALKRMLKLGGMYLSATRHYEYLLKQKILVTDPSPRRIVFGTVYSYAKISGLFKEKIPEYVVSKHEEGCNAFVYNAKLNRIIAAEENMLILEEETINSFLKGTTVLQTRKKPFFTDYEFEIGGSGSFQDAGPEENFPAYIKQLLDNPEVNFIRIKVAKYYADGTKSYAKESPLYLYNENCLVSADWARKHFDGNRQMTAIIRSHKDDIFIYDEDCNSLQPVPPRSTFMSELILKRWART